MIRTLSTTINDFLWFSDNISNKEIKEIENTQKTVLKI
jgi:hypothetical protein